MAHAGAWPPEIQTDAIIELLNRDLTSDRFRSPNNYNQDSNIDEIQSKLNKAEDNILKLVSVVDSLNVKNHALQRDILHQEKEVTELYDHVNKRNLIFINVKLDRSRNAQSLRVQVTNYIKKHISEKCNEFDIEDVSITGQLRNGLYRLKVIFARAQHRDFTYINRQKLLKSAQISIREDLHENTVQINRRLNRVNKAAKAKGLHSNIQKDRITINGVTYTNSNLSQLPYNYSLEVLSQKLTKTYIAFAGEDHFLSNRFPCNINVFGSHFISAEHAYQASKAKHHQNMVVLHKIENAKTAISAQEAGNEIPPSTSWDNIKVLVMTDILKSKFVQNPTLMSKLISLPKIEIIEATMHPFWGAKAPIQSKKFEEKSWTGQNNLGKLLMKLQEELKREEALKIKRLTKLSG